MSEEIKNIYLTEFWACYNILYKFVDTTNFYNTDIKITQKRGGLMYTLIPYYIYNNLN